MSSPDEAAAKELYLFISNDGDLYRQQGLPIIQNLVQKIDRGVYDRTLAVKLYGYLVENGGKKYAKAFGGTWHKMFDKPTRELVAKNFVAYFETEYKLGAFKKMHKKKYQGKAGVLSNPAFISDGKKFKTKVFTSVKATNTFLAKHHEYGVIGTKTVNGKEYIHVALNADNGIRIRSNPASAYHVNEMYESMKQAGVKIEHHESDMYVPVNKTTTDILKGYRFRKSVKVFYSGGKPWYDIPFAYVPFWEKQKKAATQGTVIKGNPVSGKLTKKERMVLEDIGLRAGHFKGTNVTSVYRSLQKKGYVQFHKESPGRHSVTPTAIGWGKLKNNPPYGYGTHENENPKSKKKSKKKRPVNLKAIAGAIKSPNTPKHLKEGLLRKYGHLLK